jgi:di/tricarboxylate transporter
MTIQIALLLAIICISIILFSIERLPADIVALGVLMTLILTGLLPANIAFAGFGSDAVIMILGLFILTAALARTGVVESIGRLIVSRVGESPDRLLGVLMTAPAIMSTLMSNTASTAFFLPIIIGLGRRVKINTSYLLMPLAFATILASSVTLIATSTNIVVSGLMTQHSLAPLGMFELAPVGVPILLAGLLYMMLIGRRMIPDRSISQEDLDDYRAYTYLTETIVLPDSPLAGKTLAESGLGRDLDLIVLRLERGKRRYLAPQANLLLAEGDVLVVKGKRDDILKIGSTAGIEFKAAVQISDPELQSEEIRMVEVILLVRSPWLGRTLRGLNLRELYDLQVLAIHRHGSTIRRGISRTPLQIGDVLLLQGNRSSISALEQENAFRILSLVDHITPNHRRAPIAIGAFIGALILATFNLVSFPVAVFLGVLLVFVTRCITPEEAYREVEWKALILIASMLGLGSALEVTGAAKYLSTEIVKLVGSADPRFLLAAFFLLTMLLTQPMSNQAAAVVVVPIALETAAHLGLNPRTFAVMIALGASCSFLTPLEPACLMVYGPGGYHFRDFLKVGTPLTILIFLIAILLVPIIWPL